VNRRLAVLLAISLVLAGCSKGGPDEPEAGPPVAPLTGLPADEDLTGRPLLVAKIENSPAARPQSGLDAADVVYEELVEGGVTRFISLFHSRIPELAGPVRSARPVDVELLSGLGDAPGLAYSGARDEVQQLLARTSIVLLTEGQAGFFRADDRRAPHDLYVRVPEAIDAVAERGATAPSEVAAWRFADDPPDGAETCPPEAEGCEDPGGAISVEMSTTYRTDFTYDESVGVYRRAQDGQPSEVTGDGRIGAANVVVLATEHYVGGCCDTAGNPYIETRASGDGRAVLLRDGRWYEGSWSKAGATAPLRFLDAAGEPFPLKPGPTWVLMPAEERVPSAPVS
jgi:hypothetical protein